MAKAKFTNNGQSVLAASLTNVATSFAVTAGDGAKFPALSGGDWFMATLVKLVSGVPTNEIVKVTARSSDTMTVVRAQEGTTALTFAAGDKMELRLTAATIEGKTDSASPTFSGLASFTGTMDVDGAANFDGAVTMGGTAAITGAVSLGSTVAMADQNLTRAVFKDCAMAFNDSATVNTIDYTNGQMQRWAPATGAQTLAVTNWPPSGTLGMIMLEGVNLGAATITTATIKWVKSDGTFNTTTSMNTNQGATLQTSGIDFLMLWTRDAGTTLYGKVVR